MPVVLRILLCGLLLVTLGQGRAGASLPALIRGGSLEATVEWAGCPPLRWKSEIVPGTPGQTSVKSRISLTGNGFSAHADVAYDASRSMLSWESMEVTLDLERWFAPLVGRATTAVRAADFRVLGWVVARSRGAWSPSGLSGTAEVQWTGGSVTNTPQGWEVKGLDLKVTVDDLAKRTTPPAQVIRFERARVAGVELTQAQCEFHLAAGDQVAVESATLRALGGRLTVDPFSLALGADGVRSIQARVNMVGVALTEVAVFIPKVFLAAEGRVSGGIGLAWSAERGWIIGEGGFHIDRLDAVEIRLSPQPGFLSDRVPKTFSLLPAWMGGLSRWLTAVNPAHEVLRAIEMGEMPLMVDELELRTEPSGDAEGRTARVSMSARPKSPGPVESVRFDVNVSGPLDQVVRLGIENSISGISSR